MYAKITAALGVLLLLCVVSLITYNEITQTHSIIMMKLKQDVDPISVLAQFPGQITNVRAVNKNEYEVKVVSKNSNKLVEILRKIAGVKDAQVKSP